MSPAYPPRVPLTGVGGHAQRLVHFRPNAAVLDKSGLCCGRPPTRIRGDPRFTPRVHATQQSPERSDRQPIKLLPLLFTVCDCVEGLSPSGMTSALRMHADVDPRMANRETRTGDERSLVTISLRRNLNCCLTSLHASEQCPKRALGRVGRAVLALLACQTRRLGPKPNGQALWVLSPMRLG